MGKKYNEADVLLLVRSVKREAHIEAQQIGFDLGKQAQRELYEQAEKPVSKEATHRLECPSCKSTINIPCLNYMTAPTVTEQDKVGKE